VRRQREEAWQSVASRHAGTKIPGLPSTYFATRPYQCQPRQPWELPTTNLVALSALPTSS
jgi:hypothetical protein